MADTDLVKGNKEILTKEFKDLYLIHGRRWRSLLKKHDEWHGSDTALNAWLNIAKGRTGNESLRRIISDMRSVIASTSKNNILKKQGLTRRSSTNS